MLFLIIGAIIGFLICFIAENRSVGCGLCGAIMGFLAGFIITLTLSIFLPFSIYTEEAYCETTPICALNNNASIQGQKFLFSGTIREKYIYRYIISTQDGKQVKEINNSDNVYIKEINNLETPCIKIYKTKRYIDEKTIKKWSKIAMMIRFDRPYVYITKIIFEVPTGTVTSEYNIDLE